MPFLTQLVYLKYRASAVALPAVFRPSYRTRLDASSILRSRGDAETTHRTRLGSTTTWRSRGSAK